MGSIKRIYIIHGWTYSTDKWQPLLQWLLAHNIEAVMLRVPGLTSSSEETWDIDKYVAWLHASTKNEKEPFVLVGHSNGGRIGLNFATRFPDRLERLILIGSAGIYHNEPPLRFKRAVFGALAKTGRRITSSKRMRAILYRLARAQDYHAASPNMRQTMINLQDSDLQLVLRSVVTPTTLIWGSSDKLTPISDGTYMASVIDGSELHIIQNAQHAPFYTHPTEVGELIAQALK